MLISCQKIETLHNSESEGKIKPVVDQDYTFANLRFGRCSLVSVYVSSDTEEHH